MEPLPRFLIVSLLAASETLHGGEPASHAASNGPRLMVYNRVLHRIDSRLFGQFLERPSWSGETGVEAAVVPGTHRLQPGVVEMLRDLHASILRFPGGTDVDSRDWTEMIDNAPGRAVGRPIAVTPGGERITNAFGYDEFLRLSEGLNAEPLLVVNFGDALSGRKPTVRAARHAAALVAYTNADVRARLSPELATWRDLRVRNGRAAPYKVRYFQIGNETGALLRDLKTRHPRGAVRRYIRKLTRYVQAMRAVDPSIQILTDSHGPEIDAAIRRHLGNRIAFLVEHFYRPLAIQRFTRPGQSIAASDVPQRDLWNAFVAAGPVDGKTGLSILPLQSIAGSSNHGYPIAVTEWNWNGWWTAASSPAPAESPMARGVGAAGMLHGLMRAGAVVKMAMQSIAVGKKWAITAIRVDPTAKRKPRYLPTGQVVALYAGHHGDSLLDTATQGVPAFAQPWRYGHVDASPTVATLDALATGDRRAVYLHLINRDFDRTIRLDVDVSDFTNLTGAGTRHTLVGPPESAEEVRAAELTDSPVKFSGSILRLDLAPRTVSCVELDKNRQAPASQRHDRSDRPEANTMTGLEIDYSPSTAR